MRGARGRTARSAWAARTIACFQHRSVACSRAAPFNNTRCDTGKALQEKKTTDEQALGRLSPRGRDPREGGAGARGGDLGPRGG